VVDGDRRRFGNQRGTSLPDGLDLGVRGDVTREQHAVLATRDDLTVANQDRSNGPPQPLSTDSFASRHASTMSSSGVMPTTSAVV
jgi:hypothetical protein